ncbi:hypothetical protein [Pseudoalteromonas sp. SW0106-04]|uniref:hypothetical protein n=1 Tax=Pseudoalteromonas sp. SW0106-04 TaxID=1702169 RepID=UPI000AF97A6E|nr:hypothetical protein [Pseudoalteromonas sp. SW0106-04]
MGKEVDSFYLYCLAGMSLVVVGLTWFMFSFGFELTEIHFKYPVSGLSVIVFDPIMSCTVIGWILILFVFIVAVIGSAKEMWKDNERIRLAQKQVGKVFNKMFFCGLALFVANYLLWPVWASYNDFEPCPSSTLLHNESFVTAWVTDIEICHNDKVDAVLENSLHETVLRANELIENLK